MNILYVFSEAYPFIKTGGLADVAGSLPKALAEGGADARVILPLYEGIPDTYRAQMEFVLYTYVFLSWRRQYCGLFKLELDGVTYYFIDNEYYFKRPYPYGHYDDGERFGFFSKAVYHLIPLLGWTPDVVHCNDWQSALVPIYIREDPGAPYPRVRTVFTIHNIEYQGRFGIGTVEDLFGLPRVLCDNGILAFGDHINLTKGALYTADYITTVSPTYADQLRTPDYAHGLHRVIEENSHKLRGVLNGIDTALHNPESDASLYRNYSASTVSDKVYNKLELQRRLNLTVREDIPVIGCISRLVAHKGFGMILEVLDQIMAQDVQLVVLGTGDWNYEQGFIEASHRYPGRLSANILYADALASAIYGGADLFLMPSRSEPCGLSQMIAMRYGTIPLVRETGGLKDTVFPYHSPYSTGFTFTNYNSSDMLYVLNEALSLYRDDKQSWAELMMRGMESDFSWAKSAAAYLDIYEQITQ